MSRQFLVLAMIVATPLAAGDHSKVWVSDQGGGTCKNPVPHAHVALTAKPGRWIGAKAGLFALGAGGAPENGYADFDWFKVE